MALTQKNLFCVYLIFALSADEARSYSEMFRLVYFVDFSHVYEWLSHLVVRYSALQHFSGGTTVYYHSHLYVVCFSVTSLMQIVK